MSCLERSSAICALCGEDVPTILVLSILSSNNIGLDLRPPEMESSLVHHIISCCPGCAYCSTDPSKASPIAREVVGTREYQVMSRTRKYPKVANYWRCFSLIAEREGDWAEAARRMLSAAWVCDDGDQERWAEAGRRCREKTLQLLNMARLLGQPLFEEEDGHPPSEECETAVAADLLRRLGLFREARHLVTSRLDSITDETIRKVLERQLEFIGKEDTEPQLLFEIRYEDFEDF